MSYWNLSSFRPKVHLFSQFHFFPLFFHLSTLHISACHKRHVQLRTVPLSLSMTFCTHCFPENFFHSLRCILFLSGAFDFETAQFPKSLFFSDWAHLFFFSVQIRRAWGFGGFSFQKKKESFRSTWFSVIFYRFLTLWVSDSLGFLFSRFFFLLVVILCLPGPQCFLSHHSPLHRRLLIS